MTDMPEQEGPHFSAVEGDRLVYTTLRIVEGQAPITNVFHDADGDWQFVDADGVLDHTTVVKVHIEHLLHEHPDIADLRVLPVGWHAWRDGPGQPWQIEPFSDDEDGE